MSLHPHAAYPIPEETQRVARAAFPRSNGYMHIIVPSVHSTVMSNLLTFFQRVASRRYRPLDWHWSRFCS